MKKIAIVMMILLAISCAKPMATISTTPTINRASDDASIKLAEAATSVSQALNELKAVEKAASPPLNRKRLPYPTSYDMAESVSVDWSGPIEPLLRRLACVSRYTLRVLGRPPAIPVLVVITAKNTPIGYIVRDANLQAGSKADIAVYPGIHVIELRYGKQ